jgi:hypothetical protein
MVKYLAIFLFALSAFGQAFTMRDQAFLGNAIATAASALNFSPLTIPNSPCVAYWPGSSYSGTTWTDQSGNSYNAAKVGTIATGTLDGMQTVKIAGTTGKYFNSAAPQGTYNDYYFLCSVTNNSIGYSAFFNATNGDSYPFFRMVNGAIYVANFGSSRSLSVKPITNMFYMLGIVRSNTYLWMYTNNVLAIFDTTVGSSVPKSFRIGADADGVCLNAEIASIIIYGTNLVTADRANLYNWAKTNWPSANLP